LGNERYKNQVITFSDPSCYLDLHDGLMKWHVNDEHELDVVLDAIASFVDWMDHIPLYMR
jgi:hypothetical protein